MLLFAAKACSGQPRVYCLNMPMAVIVYCKQCSVVFMMTTSSSLCRCRGCTWWVGYNTGDAWEDDNRSAGTGNKQMGSWNIIQTQTKQRQRQTSSLYHAQWLPSIPHGRSLHFPSLFTGQSTLFTKLFLIFYFCAFFKKIPLTEFPPTKGKKP